MEHTNPNQWYGTTILAIQHNGETIIAGDGQVSLGNTIMKSTANKLRRLWNGSIISGFAGATADAFTLFERLEHKLESYRGQLQKSAVELARDWRTDKYLRKLEAMLIVADSEEIFVITGNGDVLKPEGQITAIGSGGNYALSAALGILSVDNNKDLSAEDIARKSMKIAADICVYTNHEVRILKVVPKKPE
ncbi:ATP-dependent protease subunit HslV [Lyticum sinuosum]|uniref:ATP-dependent protease subunit HslV n=1 Tax=Lyticum sinuosum TaxID=1332059 RepID=A0AAE4VMA4_9RICK|nr:ATP-dependent protease subunit HslV [Lyticum sinuosum]MDZ5761576.1 ATP-dependent protease subunit HslV [Lyticum sinuosum]